MYILIRHNERKRIKAWVTAKYERLIRDFDLTINEMDFIDRLSIYLKYPEKKYLLLQNRMVFSSALNRLKEHEAISSALLASLTGKLHYNKIDTRAVVKPFSTVNISINSPVLVEIDKKKLRGYVTKNDSKVLGVTTRDHIPSQTEGVRVFLYTGHARGFYAFISQINSIADHTLYLDHRKRETIKQKNVDLPIFIQKEDEKRNAVLKTSLTTLLSNGAILLNPEKKLRKHDDIQLFIDPKMKDSFYTNAEIVKRYAKRTHIEVRFAHVA
jgi:hypothetical protein